MPKFSDEHLWPIYMRISPLRKNCNLLAGIHLVTSQKRNSNAMGIPVRSCQEFQCLLWSRKVASFPGSILPKKNLDHTSFKTPAKKSVLSSILPRKNLPLDPGENLSEIPSRIPPRFFSSQRLSYWHLTGIPTKNENPGIKNLARILPIYQSLFYKKRNHDY